MELYKAMFYCNIESDRDNNFIKAESLRIELIAGGLNWKQQEFVMDRLQPNHFMEVLYFHCFRLHLSFIVSRRLSNSPKLFHERGLWLIELQNYLQF